MRMSSLGGNLSWSRTLKGMNQPTLQAQKEQEESFAEMGSLKMMVFVNLGFL